MKVRMGMGIGMDLGNRTSGKGWAREVLHRFRYSCVCIRFVCYHTAISGMVGGILVSVRCFLLAVSHLRAFSRILLWPTLFPFLHLERQIVGHSFIFSCTHMAPIT